jgi:hypothetical protein
MWMHGGGGSGPVLCVDGVGGGFLEEGIDVLYGSVERGEVERQDALMVGQAGIGAVLEQPLRHLGVTPPDGEEEGGLVAIGGPEIDGSWVMPE